MTRRQVFLLDSGTGVVTKVNSPLLLECAHQVAEYQQVMKAVTESRGSKALRQKYGVALDGVNCAARQFDFALFAYATALNTYHSRACRAKAKDIVGRGWKIGGDGSEGLRKTITDFFTNAFSGTGKEFGDGMICCWTDYEALGNGYIEVIPDGKMQPAELAHIPAPEVWTRLDGLGFVQQKSGEYAHFRAFGVPSEKYKELPATDPLSATAGDQPTSLIHFARYSPWSPFYGIPAIITAWNCLALMTLVAEYNLHFFANNAIPDYAVILEGKWNDDAEDLIRQYFREHLKGQAHKTLCITTPEGGKITFEKLTSDNAKEGSFRLLRQDCRDEILHAHGVPPQKVGIVETGSLGGNLATEQKKEYKDSIVAPGQNAISARLNKVIARGFEAPALKFEFEAYDTEDRTANVAEDSAYLDRNVLAPNEVRAKRFPNLKPLDGGDEPNRRPTVGDLAGIDTALADLQKEVREAIAK